MNLKSLSDKHLLDSAAKLAKQEREVLVKILWHLREIDQRKLYCDLKCGSLFEYCVKILKYSEGQASRRIKASRLLKELPEITPKIESGSLNLTKINQVGQFILDEGITNKREKLNLFNKVDDKSTRETEQILWDLKKEEAPRTVKITLLDETLQEIRKAQALKAHAYPNLDKLLMHMAREFQGLWDPTVIKRKSSVVESDTRYVPTQVRAAVWERDVGRCQNCGSYYALEIDHKVPFAKGGKTTVENLQLLCRNCNQRKGVSAKFTHENNNPTPSPLDYPKWHPPTSGKKS